MKKTGIFLSLAFAVAIASCGQDEDEWIDGQTNGRYIDTVAHGHYYRYYGGRWYPVYDNRISPGSYNGASSAEISNPGFTPTRSSGGGGGGEGVESGGFGSSAHGSSGE